jgi:DUF1365 family protein
MANVPFSFQVGEFVDVNLSNGMKQIGWIHGVNMNIISACWWAIDNTYESSESFLIPMQLVATNEQDILFNFQPLSLLFCFQCQ